MLVAALRLLLPGLDLRLPLSVLSAAPWLLLPGLDLRLLLSVLGAALLLSALALRLLIVLSAALPFALALLLALVLLLFALALIIFVFVFLRCVNRDSPENQEQNSCTDQSDSLKKSSSYFVISTLLHKMPPFHSIPLTTFNLHESFTRSTQRAVHV